MPSTVSWLTPGVTRVGVDPPVGQQIQLRVEQLPIQLLTRQLPPAAPTQDTQHRFGVLHFAYLPILIGIFKHLAPLALWTAFPSALAGRCSCDYYGASVAIGFASRRRSHVRLGRTVQRDVGAPLISLNVQTGHRSAS